MLSLLLNSKSVDGEKHSAQAMTGWGVPYLLAAPGVLAVLAVMATSARPFGKRHSVRNTIVRVKDGVRLTAASAAERLCCSSSCLEHLGQTAGTRSNTGR